MKTKTFKMTLLTTLFCLFIAFAFTAQTNAAEYGAYKKGDTITLTKTGKKITKCVSSDSSVVKVKSFSKNGKVVTVKLKAKKAGSAVLSFVKSNGKKTLYYITVTKNEDSLIFMDYMSEISGLCKSYSDQITYGTSDSSENYFTAATKLSNGSSISMTELTAAEWSLKTLNLCNGTFSISNAGKVSGLVTNNKLKQIKSGSVIGKSVKSAAASGLLKPGDIILAGNYRVVYYGKDSSGNPLIYESGKLAQAKGLTKVGCGPFTNSKVSSAKIKTILRWK